MRLYCLPLIKKALDKMIPLNKIATTCTASPLRTIITAVSLSLFATGCATSYEPRDLHTPNQVTCVYLAAPLSSLSTNGLTGSQWETRLERGPYISVKEDQDGIYYEGPPGGISRSRLDGKDTTIKGDHHTTFDGGFWLPRDPNVNPRLYTYSLDLFHHSAVQLPPENANCATSSYARDTAANTVKLVMPQSDTSATDKALANGDRLEQTAPTGHIGPIFQAILDAQEGKVYPGPVLTDLQFAAKIKDVASHPVVLHEATVTTTAAPATTVR